MERVLEKGIGGEKKLKRKDDSIVGKGKGLKGNSIK